MVPGLTKYISKDKERREYSLEEGQTEAFDTAIRIASTVRYLPFMYSIYLAVLFGYDQSRPQ